MIEKRKEIVAYRTDSLEVKTTILNNLNMKKFPSLIKSWKVKYITNDETLSFAKGSYLYDLVRDNKQLHLLKPIYRYYMLVDYRLVKAIFSGAYFGSKPFDFEKEWEVSIKGERHPDSREIVNAMKNFMKDKEFLHSILFSNED